MKSKRRQLLIDRPVQLHLVTRMFFHWCTFLGATIVMLPLFRAIVFVDIATPLTERFRLAGIDAAIVLVLFVTLLPYFIYDTFRTTNRFVGPMYRLRNSIHEMSEGARFQPIQLRQDDFWRDVADDYNKMVEHLQNDNGDASETEDADQVEAVTA